MNFLHVIKPGLYSSIQDGGRVFGGHLGIPSSGAMDRISFNTVNNILGNDSECSVIEATIIGPEIKFSASTYISIAGAIIQPLLNGLPVAMYQIIDINKGDILSFGKIVNGARFYIGIQGGFNTESIYGSQSACPTAGIKRLLKKGDSIPFFDSSFKPSIRKNFEALEMGTIIKANKGPEYKVLSLSQKEQLKNAHFVIRPESNRMAYRIDHDISLKHSSSILSSGVLPGMVQLTQGGDFIILMRDAQTTGGYPRILQLEEESISHLSQLKSGESFSIQIQE